MKKMLLSLILVLSVFAFAAESAASSTVGYVKYSLVRGTTKGNNFMSMPFSQYAWSQDFANANPTIDQVSEWIPTGAQGWNTMSWDPDFGEWSTNFALSLGKALMVNTTAAANVIISGNLQSDPVYSLIKGTTKGNNAIMHPLGKNSITGSIALATNIGANCDQVSEWIPTGAQGWNTMSWDPDFGEWSQDIPTSIGKALMVNVTANTSWPSKEEYDVADKPNGKSSSNPKSGTPRIMGVSVRNASGVKYDFTPAGLLATEPDSIVSWVVQLKRGNTLYPTKLTQISTGSQYTNTTTHSMARVNIGNFEEAWQMGDSLRWQLRDNNGKALGRIIMLPILDNNTTLINYGVTAGWVFDGPWSISAPSSIEDSTLPLETKLHQNYPNPFNPTTTIKFDLASAGNVKLNVYNYNGQLVKSLVNGEMKAGFQRVDFDASSLAAGVYYYTMQTAGKTMTHKMVLIK